MELIDWLDEVLALQDTPEDVLIDNVEESIDHLRQKAHHHRIDLLNCAGRPYAASLLEMTEHLLDITDDLDEFLETSDFRLVRAARLRAVELTVLENSLYLKDPDEIDPLL